MSDNPYQATGAVPNPDAGEATERIAKAQKLVIYALLCYLVAVFGQILLGPAILAILLGTLVMGLLGVVRLARAFGYGSARTALVVIALFVPLAGLIVLLRLNAKATAVLKQAGWRVGLLGATP